MTADKSGYGYAKSQSGWHCHTVDSQKGIISRSIEQPLIAIGGSQHYELYRNYSSLWHFFTFIYNYISWKKKLAAIHRFIHKKREGLSSVKLSTLI